jgi:hypothetical protein
MKKFLVISVSLLAFLLFSSKKCSSPGEEDAAREDIALKTELDSINKEFKADYLSGQSIDAFEVKAKQKLADLADYLRIYSDPSLDKSFRDHTRKMIIDLFLSDTVRVMLKPSAEQKEENLSITGFLKLFPVSGKNPMEIVFDSVVLSEPLHRVDELNYKGSLEFLCRYEDPGSPDKRFSCSVSKKIDIIAVKVKKQFGNDTLRIWQILLGNIH